MTPEKYIPSPDSAELRNSEVKKEENSTVPEAEKDSIVKEYEKRRAEHERKKFLFLCGELPPEHPVQQYVESLVGNLSVKMGVEGVRIKVLPRWRENNACVYDDGTIMVGSGLLRKAEFEEEIQGVLGHELWHHKRRHLKLRAEMLEKTMATIGGAQEGKPASENAFEAFAKASSISRIHETEADVKGGIFALDEAGINPLGYKLFLEKQESAERWGDSAHGRSIDRVLNMESLAHFFDFSALSHDLTPIQSEMTEQIAGIADYGENRRLIWLLPFRAQISPEVLQQRDKMVAGLTKEELMIAYEYAAEEEARIKGRYKIRLFKGMTKAQYAALPDAFKYARESRKMLWEKVQGAYADLQPAPIPAPVPKKSPTIQDLMDIKDNNSSNDDKYRQETRKDAESALDKLPLNEANRAKIKKYFDKIASETEKELLKVEESYNRDRLFSPNLSAWRHNKWCGEALDGILKILEEEGQLSELEVFGVISTFVDHLTNVTLIDQPARIMSFENATDDQYPGAFRELMALLPIQAVNKLPQFNGWPLIKKELFSRFILDSTIRDGYLAESKAGESKYYGEEQDAYFGVVRVGGKVVSRFSAITQKMVKSEKDIYKMVGVTDDDLLFLYNLKFSSDYTRKLGLTYIKEGGGVTDRILGHQLAEYLGTGSIKKVFKKANHLKESGLSVDKVFDHCREATARLLHGVLGDIEKGGLSALSMEEAWQFSGWVQSPTTREALRQMLTGQQLARLSKDEKFDFLFKGVHGRLQEQNLFIENECRTKEELDRIKKHVIQNVDRMVSGGSGSVFLWEISDRISLQFTDVNQFLARLLESSTHDLELKRFMYKTISERKNDPPGSFVASDEAVRAIYNLDGIKRRMLVRKLLTGEYGALTVPDRRAKFLDTLLQKTVEEGQKESDTRSIINDVVSAMKKTKQWDIIYFAIQGILADRIGQPPSKEASWSDVYEITEDMGIEVDDKNDEDDEDDLEGVFDKRLFEKKGLTVSTLKEPTKEMLKNPMKYSWQISRIVCSRLDKWLNKQGVFEHGQNEEKLSPIDFAIHVGENIGAVGVRFLQILPQFARIPEQYKDRFNDVYDQASGQSKISATSTLEREWGDMWQDIAELGKRVGGGSLMTVYECVTKAGEKQAIKVRNPNLIYHLELAADFIREILTELIKSGKKEYLPALLSLDDVSEWIKSDVSFENFLQEDAEFNQKWSGFKPEGFKYGIYIPKTHGPESKYFMREEFIEGKNLTKWEELEKEGHNMKEICALLVNHYVAQLLDGVVHSDVHIGNFRVMADGRVAVLDRNFYLHYSDVERATIQDILSPMSSAEDKSLALMKLVTAGGADIDKETREILENNLAKISGGDMDAIFDTVVDLKKAGVKFPLKFTLLLKNISSLNRIAHRAGFKDIGEALFGYSPTS